MPTIHVHLTSGSHLELNMSSSDTNILLKAFEKFAVSQRQDEAAFKFNVSDALVLDFTKVEAMTGEH